MKWLKNTGQLVLIAAGLCALLWASSAAAKEAPAEFTISAEPAKIATGADGVSTVTITPAKGWKWNMQYPSKLIFESDGKHAALTQKKITKADKGFQASEKQASVAVSLKGVSAGAETITGKVSFSVCNEDRCLMKKAPVSIAVQVQ